MIVSVECINNRTGDLVRFGRLPEPFMMKSLEGVSSFKSEVSVSDNTMTDGAEYLGSVQEKRNIVISGKMLGDPLELKSRLYRCFNVGDVGTITLRDDSGEERKAEYYPEGVDADGTCIPAKTFQISLICPDPALYAAEESVQEMANWVSDFTFPHNFVEDGETLGHRSAQRLLNIKNHAGMETGLTFEIRCDGEVTNPKIINAVTTERIEIGSERYPFTLHPGEVLTITTGTNDKHAYHTVDGVRKEVNQYVSEVSSFFQLENGSNSIGYDADEGEEYIAVAVRFRYKYRGM